MHMIIMLTTKCVTCLRCSTLIGCFTSILLTSRFANTRNILSPINVHRPYRNMSARRIVDKTHREQNLPCLSTNSIVTCNHHVIIKISQTNNIKQHVEKLRINIGVPKSRDCLKQTKKTQGAHKSDAKLKIYNPTSPSDDFS